MVPELTLSGEPTIALTEKDQLELVCTAVGGWPEPSLVWLLDGTLLISSSRVDVDATTIQGEDGLFVATSTLTIPSVQPDQDTGIYTCRADPNIPDIPSLSLDANITVQG